MSCIHCGAEQMHRVCEECFGRCGKKRGRYGTIGCFLEFDHDGPAHMALARDGRVFSWSVVFT